MHKLPVPVAAAALLSIALAGCQTSSRTITTASLLAELTDLERLAVLPDPAFTCAQFSSYDRRSTSRTQTEPPLEGWFANGDAGKFLRTEQLNGRTEHVMMDAAGPGAIVRIWSANPQGTLRVYLDGAAFPTLEVPFADFLTGRIAGFPSPVTGMRSRGCNSYFPLPYARHCLVTCDVRDFYYHINYRTYPVDTAVVSFTPADPANLADRVARAARALESPRTAGAADEAPLTPALSRTNQRLAPGATVMLAELRGPAAITSFCLRPQAANLEAALRETLLTIDFDGVRCVEAPLGDFFGSAPGRTPFESLPTGVTMDGVFWTQWRMPFARDACVQLHNRGAQPLELNWELRTRPHRWTARSLHFHARWRALRDQPTRPMRDLHFVTLDGSGVFVGTALSIANPVRPWWGEGDEKIYVDGESLPSHFGTGTEDYFGYAWSSNVPFTHAFHNQPRCDGPGNYGYTANNRWHILDCIPFERSLQFDMELWHWEPDCRVDLAVVMYWYARPGTTCDFTSPTAADLAWTPVPPYVMFKVPFALEAEDLPVLQKRAAARVDPHGMKGASADQTLLYHYDAALGDKLVLGFPVAEAGRYRVYARYLKSRDFGIVQWSLNDTPAGTPADLYAPEPQLTAEVVLGEFELHAGQNRLTAEVIGSNDRSGHQRYMFGLDYIRLERVE